MKTKDTRPCIQHCRTCGAPHNRHTPQLWEAHQRMHQNYQKLISDLRRITRGWKGGQA